LDIPRYDIDFLHDCYRAGIHLVEKACFDSKNAIDVFVRLRQHVDKTKEENGETLYTRGVVTDLIATHPDTLARITALHLARETEQFKAIEKDAKLCRTRITADFSKAEVPNKEKKDKRTQQNAP
jgi:predicted Zn-dependent protease